jgi:ComF family protein
MPIASPTPAHRLVTVLLDLIYPRRCGGCRRLGAWLCMDCLEAMAPPATPGWVCARCQSALVAVGASLACPAGCTPGDLIAVLCVGAYDGPLREAIHRLKYDGWRVLGEPLGTLLAATCTGTPLPWPGEGAPYLVPVPLHPRRERERGFNQAAVLARTLAAHLDWPVLPGLARVRHTPHQVGLSAGDREANLEDAFAWRGPARPPTTPILLVDDVYTTGVTLGNCAEALRAAGAGPVYGVALARPASG